MSGKISITRRMRGPEVAERPAAFWLGIAAVTTGVILHLPMWVSGSKMHYMLVGMSMGTPMLVGMGLIVVGLLLTAYGLVPGRSELDRGQLAQVSIRPLDDARLSYAHLALLIVMTFAVVIDVMKPVSLGFVVPGMAKEYGLKSVANPHAAVPVAWLPFFGITGTVIGSFVWGSLADRIGRRASILLAAVLFMSTAICGAMPDYRWNFFMCFMMGLAAGGMLPITFALISETMPSRHRGWLMVLLGAQFALAYILTSWLASLLTPHYSWRILWLIGLPTGLLLILLNRWIPESPRFLIARGRGSEAEAVMERYGARAVIGSSSELAVEEGVRGSWRVLASRRLISTSTVVCVLALGIGLVAFGFQLWLPSNLQKLGFTEVSSDKILRDGALIGLPATFVLAALYGLWSSRKTIILLALITVAALVGFVIAGNGIVHHRALLYLLLAVPITATGSTTAVALAYASEVYPTKVRSRGTGLAAGASKVGGVAISALVVAAVAPPSIATTALIGAVPLALAAVLAAVFGVETRQRRLEEITADEFAMAERVAPAAPATPS
jgi:MFS transporter, putative metabolite:H+ symporter